MKLAKAIENEKDLDVLVERHPIRIRSAVVQHIRTNRDLSVIRATSVVRIMQEENSVIDPVRLTATGRGEYIPVDPTTNEESAE